MHIIRTIFIIDDDTDDQELLTEAIQDIDPSIGCRTAEDGLKAFHLLVAEMKTIPDLIFLDLNMPRMGGKQFLAELKKHPDYRRIPVIIYTTSSEAEDIEECSRLGAVDFITKPTRPSKLRELLRQVFAMEWAL